MDGIWNNPNPLLDQLPVPKASRLAARLLVFGLLALLLLLVTVPWQQNAAGRGRVVAFSPTERQQNLDAPIEGRIAQWHVVEGQQVRKGQPIVDLTDNDPDLITRLQREREAVQARLRAAEVRVNAIDSRMVALRSSQQSAVQAARARTDMGSERRRAADSALEAAQALYKAARLNSQRQRSLFQSGLTSQRALEVAEADEIRLRNEVERAQNAVYAAQSEITALSSDQARINDDAFAGLNDAGAAKAVAQTEIAAANAELARIETRLARQDSQHIRAPSNGTILRIYARQGGELLKAGDPLAQFIPEGEQLAVELWIDGNDVNLIHPDSMVRLQFEGWPAIQFSGWPSAAIGTFGGKVAFIDPQDDGKGRFRIVVIPDAAQDWPAGRYLRQGSRATGWVLMNEVKLGYELWRQFNGFPPEWTGEKDTGLGKEGKPSPVKKGSP